MTDKHGYIYVLTNTSFPEYVKIGYADNVDERVAQLNRSECTPFAFKKYDAKCKWNQGGKPREHRNCPPRGFLRVIHFKFVFSS